MMREILGHWLLLVEEQRVQLLLKTGIVSPQKLNIELSRMIQYFCYKPKRIEISV